MIQPGRILPVWTVSNHLQGRERSIVMTVRKSGDQERRI